MSTKTAKLFQEKRHRFQNPERERKTQKAVEKVEEAVPGKGDIMLGTGL